ncbi:MAG: hypothetical protein OEQ81_06055 [Flavobacteriaceae bacterium]|nr:hypothetical protein [Flavobacteriaceae bacterium]
MKIKKYVIQALVAVALYVLISMILEGEYSTEILVREISEGLLFGILYGIFLAVRDKFMGRKKD